MLMQIEARKLVQSSKLKEHFTKLRIFHQTKLEATLIVNLSKLEELHIVPGTSAFTFDLDIVLDPAELGNSVNTYPINNLSA
jgi:alpha-N-acetylglucosamine transferase